MNTQEILSWHQVSSLALSPQTNDSFSSYLLKLLKIARSVANDLRISIEDIQFKKDGRAFTAFHVDVPGLTEEQLRDHFQHWYSIYSQE